MPKVKTHKGASKRFRTTGTGKITFRRTKRHHSMIKKSPQSCRRLYLESIITDGKKQVVARQLQNGIPS